MEGGGGEDAYRILCVCASTTSQQFHVHVVVQLLSCSGLSYSTRYYEASQSLLIEGLLRPQKVVTLL